ncbi:MAG TPA: hypothetical protein VHX88_18515 [Solirubrobacteraceae bacterium]|jgi:hypothetical protein|nr:hypothetical protein [Solirubrobacteraceae bacterium]
MIGRRRKQPEKPDSGAARESVVEQLAQRAAAAGATPTGGDPLAEGEQGHEDSLGESFQTQ